MVRLALLCIVFASFVCRAQPTVTITAHSSTVGWPPIEVTGKFNAVLWATSDAPSADFAAKLIDVYPDGYALIVADGIARVEMGNGPPKVVVDAGSISNLFTVGHRIRVDIAGSSFPRYEPNPAAGNNVILHTPARASYIERPVSHPREGP
jgi:putative CocE/NonD family hydrolase